MSSIIAPISLGRASEGGYPSPLPGDKAQRLISKSWQRCQAYGLDPRKKPKDANVLEGPQVKEERERHGELLKVANAEMHSLYQQVSGSGWSLLLTDNRGVILDYVGDPNLRREFRSAGLWLGADWSERHEGTNGIGTALTESRPVAVLRDQHYKACHHALSCCGAPILDANGQVMAVLDASTVNGNQTPETQSHTLALVTLSAQFISKWRFLEEFSDAIIIRFHSRCEYVGLINDGVLAVSRDGTIVGADHNACVFLGLPDRHRLIGWPIDQVLDIRPEILVERAERPYLPYWVLTTAQGTQLHARIQLGHTAAGRRAAEQPARPVPVQSRSASQPRDHRATLCTLEALKGNDPRMARNVNRAYRIIDKDIPILLNGETGTGKELFARAVHTASSRRDGPFVAVNCASIPEPLIESELFGYKGGAFTGADRNGRKGKILQAHGGTLFLDEIGDMPLELQARLLRVLEEREIVPIGGDKPQAVDVYLVSATHHNLPELVAEGRFREDLYYRLNGLTLTLPPLRDRADCQDVIRCILRLESDGRVDIDQAALAVLRNHPWPGNIRQLRNVLRTAVALSDGETLTVEDLPDDVLDAAETAGDDQVIEGTCTGGGDPLANAERRALQAALEQHGGNVSRTAESLGVSRNTLYRKMRRHGLGGARGG
ncbi:sigma-54-dependent Fis family transcriptional regulator [Alkalilimnicola ehrlichii MLHE-1]|uniref:GAF modulated sigma54 specific transcriptional regulator, Fis family n=1 Tax=Alkalilimnicola ehrlichii (strain ATCC BAA-1101 / DSM 17681 / MLHE-1) TaxID=187272 RepID=Q0A511_ALKEH|nr:sigma-54-dependent Fis family transcriptional regulator [Alkalilimnicola ehrlichii]ABI58076.1 GAF modulated sigma54 specific transcriptional regulator, Fis family [Alkalilimnicola ehrlichii MLHE-1]